MNTMCLVKHTGFRGLLEIFSSPLTADGKIDPSIFYQTVNEAVSYFECYFSLYLIQCMHYSLYIYNRFCVY